MNKKNQIYYGQRQGYWEHHYPSIGLNGENIKNRIFACGYYVDGNKFGLWKTFLTSGVLKNEALFYNNLLNGKTKNYHDNGKISNVGKYKKGQKIDLWCYYDNKAILNKEILFIL